jgi:hypothetical protein
LPANSAIAARVIAARKASESSIVGRPGARRTFAGTEVSFLDAIEDPDKKTAGMHRLHPGNLHHKTGSFLRVKLS